MHVPMFAQKHMLNWLKKSCDYYMHVSLLCVLSCDYSSGARRQTRDGQLDKDRPVLCQRCKEVYTVHSLICMCTCNCSVASRGGGGGEQTFPLNECVLSSQEGQWSSAHFACRNCSLL